MTLLYPWVLLGLPLFWLCEKYCSARIPRIYFPNFTMLLSATGNGIDIARLLRYTIAGLMLLALSAPVQQHTLTQEHGVGYDISLLLDASNSMEEDKRFETAKTIISHFVKSRQGDRLALSVFADYAYFSVPLTSHTDALNTVKSVPLHIALTEAKKQHLKVYAIGIGDDYRKSILQRIAKETGGRFYSAGDPKALQSIYQEINQLEKRQFSTESIALNTPFFRYPLLLALLLTLPYLLLRYRQGTLDSRAYGMLALMLVALYGPYTAGEKLQLSSPEQSIMLALDLSYSMNCEDSYPSRLKIAYNRASTLIDLAPESRIGIAGFATQSYLIAPPTQDHANLKQLLRQMDLSHIHREGSDLLSAIQSAGILLKTKETKKLLLFTDGGEQQTFEAEIAYAKAEHIQVSVYAIGTRKGGVIKQQERLRKDASGHIIITRVNPAVETLATETGGVYARHSSTDHTLRTLLNTLQTKQGRETHATETRYLKRELFYLPLFLALLLLSHIPLGFRRRT